MGNSSSYWPALHQARNSQRHQGCRGAPVLQTVRCRNCSKRLPACVIPDEVQRHIEAGLKGKSGSVRAEPPGASESVASTRFLVFWIDPCIRRRNKVNNNNPLKVCRLCGRLQLLCESHVIPKFCYKYVRDQNKIIQLESIGAEDVVFHEQNGGIKESLLCRDCEQQFSRYEDHAARLFSEPTVPIGRESLRTRLHPGIEYERMKLFFLSLLWRCSVAKHPFFSRVSLGPHENRLLDMLRKQDAGLRESYPMIIIRLKIGDEPIQGLLSEPLSTRSGAIRWHLFVIAGFLISMAVGARPIDRNLLRLALAPRTPVYSFDTEMNEIGFLRNAAVRVKKAKEIKPPKRKLQ